MKTMKMRWMTAGVMSMALAACGHHPTKQELVQDLVRIQTVHRIRGEMAVTPLEEQLPHVLRHASEEADRLCGEEPEPEEAPITPYKLCRMETLSVIAKLWSDAATCKLTVADDKPDEEFFVCMMRQPAAPSTAEL
ncbi:hypothetical protein [Piscinibacter terrae]|uniref:hypothetical protein n=1 Tax=Piscinibacter terrae TaxID=2496871 RepID=UPI000F59047C|nr:hypothetical protein [Albitalea terrae]